MADNLAGYAPQLQLVADGRILPAASKYYQQPNNFAGCFARKCQLTLCMASAPPSSSSDSPSATDKVADAEVSACIIGVAALHASFIMGETCLLALEMAAASAEAMAACAPAAGGGGAENERPAALAADCGNKSEKLNARYRAT
jgi:hypothetical protein